MQIKNNVRFLSTKNGYDCIDSLEGITQIPILPNTYSYEQGKEKQKQRVG